MPLTQENLVDVLLDASKGIVHTLFHQLLALSGNPNAGKNADQPEHKDINNQKKEIDDFARSLAIPLIKSVTLQYDFAIDIYGEEEGKYPDSLDGNKNIIAFLDPVDGTDNHLRGLSNWCFSLVFYQPSKRRILCSVIGHSGGILYYANDNGAYKERISAENEEAKILDLVKVPSTHTSLSNSTICYYGQKPKNFLAFATNSRIRKELKTWLREWHGMGKLKPKSWTFGFTTSEVIQ